MQIALLCVCVETVVFVFVGEMGDGRRKREKAGLECFRREREGGKLPVATKRRRTKERTNGRGRDTERERRRIERSAKKPRKTTPCMIDPLPLLLPPKPGPSPTLSLNFIPSQIQEPFVTARALRFHSRARAEISFLHCSMYDYPHAR